MKRWIVILVAVAALLLAGVAVIFLILDGPESLRRRRHFESVVRSGDHAQLAQAAVRFMQQSPTSEVYVASSFNAPGISSLPSEIVDLNPNWVSVYPDQMTIEMHGGFDHFGFEIRREGDQWQMSAYTGGSRQYILSVPGKLKKERSEPQPEPDG